MDKFSKGPDHDNDRSRGQRDAGGGSRRDVDVELNNLQEDNGVYSGHMSGRNLNPYQARLLGDAQPEWGVDLNMKCGNCKRYGHNIEKCIRCDNFGFVAGCAACNTLEHDTDRCPGLEGLKRYNYKAWWDRMISLTVGSRAGKPPLRCTTWDWCKEAQAVVYPLYPLVRAETLEWLSRNEDPWKRYDYAWSLPLVPANEQVIQTVDDLAGRSGRCRTGGEN